MDLPEKIMKKLVCSQCNQALSVFPVYSYENGEFVCGRCPLIVDQKPSRDFSYETFAEYVNFPCVHKVYGCIELLTPSELKLHEPNCLYRQWFCTHLTNHCNWQGMLHELDEHYEEDHPGYLLQEFQRFNFENKAENWDTNFLLRAIQEVFLVQVKKTNENLYLNVCLIGANRASRRYNYSISIYTKSQEDGLDFPKNKVLQNTGEARIDQDKAYAIDLKVLEDFKNEKLECEVLITRDIEYLNEPEKLSSLNEYILKHIECPVCFEYMSAPIFQCSNSHVICEACKEQSSNCPSCRVVIGDIRNRVLEEITENVLYGCRFEGCSCIYTFQDKRKHEAECEYSPYECPFEGCYLKSNYCEMFDHFPREHFEDFLQTQSVNIYFEHEYTNMNVLKKGNCIFIVKRATVDGMLCVGVFHFGPKEVGNNFDFVFDLHNVDSGERVYMRMKCLSMEDFYDTHGNLSLPLDMLSRYKDDICATCAIHVVERSEK